MSLASLNKESTTKNATSRRVLGERRGRLANERLDPIDEEALTCQTTSQAPDAFQACRLGNLELVRQLVGKANCDERETSNRRSSCLHFASGFGRRDVCEYLLDECGADPSVKDEGLVVCSYSREN